MGVLPRRGLHCSEQHRAVLARYAHYCALVQNVATAAANHTGWLHEATAVSRSLLEKSVDGNSRRKGDVCIVQFYARNYFLKRDYGHTKTDKIYRQLHAKYKRNAFCAAPGTRQVTHSSWLTPVGYMGGSWKSYNITASPQVVQFGRKPFLIYLRYASLGVCIADKASPLISVAIS